MGEEHEFLFIFIDEGDAQYQLDVDLSTLTFTHHPLFSKEHVLASRLQQNYKQYTERRRKALSLHYSDKVLFMLTIAYKYDQHASFDCFVFQPVTLYTFPMVLSRNICLLLLSQPVVCLSTSFFYDEIRTPHCRGG